MPSSVIRAFHYEPTRKRLQVVFTSGRRYSYFAVPPELYEQFKHAASKGEFFNAAIRDHFPYAREG
jgi:lysyl-tRNA synthetase class 2